MNNLPSEPNNIKSDVEEIELSSEITHTSIGLENDKSCSNVFLGNNDIVTENDFECKALNSTPSSETISHNAYINALHSISKHGNIKVEKPHEKLESPKIVVNSCLISQSNSDNAYIRALQSIMKNNSIQTKENFEPALNPIKSTSTVIVTNDKCNAKKTAVIKKNNNLKIEEKFVYEIKKKVPTDKIIEHKSDLVSKFRNSDCDIDKTNIPLKRRLTRIRRKKTSDIYESGSDFDDEDAPDKKRFDRSNDDTDFELPSTSKTRTSPSRHYDNDFDIANGKVSKNAETGSSIIDDVSVDSKSDRSTSKKMMKSMSDELKQMIVDSIETGVCNRQTAASVFQVPYSTVVHLYKKFLETGCIEKQNREKKLTEEHVKFLADTLAENCTYTIKELTAMVQDVFKIEVSNASVSKKLAAFHYNIKRDPEIPIVVATEELVNDHREYCELFLELYEVGRTIIYLDEAVYKIWMRRFSGRVDSTLPGQSIAPSMRTRRRTVIVSMTNNKLLLSKTWSEKRTKENLFAYLKELFQILKKQVIREAVLIMGHMSLDHMNEIKKMIQSEGHQLIYLPQHNKWFNPVEMMLDQWISVVHAKKPVNEKNLEYLMDNFSALTGDKYCPKCCTQMIDNINRCMEGRLKYDN